MTSCRLHVNMYKSLSVSWCIVAPHPLDGGCAHTSYCVCWVAYFKQIQIQYTGICHPASHSVGAVGWQAKMASLELWIQWCNAYGPIGTLLLGCDQLDNIQCRMIQSALSIMADLWSCSLTCLFARYRYDPAMPYPDWYTPYREENNRRSFGYYPYSS